MNHFVFYLPAHSSLSRHAYLEYVYRSGPHTILEQGAYVPSTKTHLAHSLPLSPNCVFY